MKYYLAYGSNLNLDQMAWRCPSATPIGTACLQDWRLVYKGSLTGAYLTIEPECGSSVPLGVWAIDRACEAALDRYEGCPTFYSKTSLKLPVCGFDGQELGELTGLIYIMNSNRSYSLPSRTYIHTCLVGYEDFGFDRKILDQALRTTRRNMK